MLRRDVRNGFFQVRFRFGFEKNRGFGFGFGSVLKTVGLVFFVDQLLADLQRTVYPY